MYLIYRDCTDGRSGLIIIEAFFCFMSLWLHVICTHHTFHSEGKKKEEEEEGEKKK